SHASGHQADALRDHLEALTIREALVRRDAESAEYRRERAQSYHNVGRLQREMGRLADASRSLKQARDLRLTYTRTNPDDLVNLACGCALLSPPGAGSPGGATAEQRAEGREAAEQAIEAIRQAIAHGYEDLGTLIADDDLNPLQSRDDFKAILGGLARR